MQLTKRELTATQLIVTTPEKWDVTTRKGSDGLVQAVGLLIIDEVHLLNDERGPVIEALVARTLRLVESSQQMIRIVGLSATFPNHVDVALFLRVNPNTGLYHFGPEYRPVPLKQTFIGVKNIESPKEGVKPVSQPKVFQQQQIMMEVAYEKCVAALRNGKQVRPCSQSMCLADRLSLAVLHQSHASCRLYPAYKPIFILAHPLLSYPISSSVPATHLKITRPFVRLFVKSCGRTPSGHGIRTRAQRDVAHCTSAVGSCSIAWRKRALCCEARSPTFWSCYA